MAALQHLEMSREVVADVSMISTMPDVAPVFRAGIVAIGPELSQRKTAVCRPPAGASPELYYGCSWLRLVCWR